MSKLGELIDYTGEECPNCGRVRVELWSCGKRICEKCHWCIEDQAYCYDDEEDDYAEYYRDSMFTAFGLPRTVVDEIADKFNSIGTVNPISPEELRIVLYKERAAKLGITIEQLEIYAIQLNTSIDEVLSNLESLVKYEPTIPHFDEFDGDTLSIYPLYSPTELEPESKWTDAQIRKQLKYERNPMRIKELNKMLSGRRKKRK